MEVPDLSPGGAVSNTAVGHHKARIQYAVAIPAAFTGERFAKRSKQIKGTLRARSQPETRAGLVRIGEVSGNSTQSHGSNVAKRRCL